MKKLILLPCILLLLSVAMLAQTWYPYSFSKSNQPYTYLSGATSLTNGNLWDDTVVVAPIGFNFKFLNNTNSSDSILFSTWGFLAFRNEYYPTPYIWMGRSMLPFAGDLRDKSAGVGPAKSDISYQTIGAVGNRIFKLQCENIGFYDDTTQTDSLNFQVWLYEAGNIIEYHYGPSKFSPNAWYWQDGGCRIGIYNDVSIDTLAMEYWVNNSSNVTGDSNTAAISQYTNTYDFFAPNTSKVLSGGPSNGQVFKFSPSNNVAIKEIEKSFEHVRVSYVFGSEQIHVEHDGQVKSYCLINVDGRLIAQGLMEKNKNTISTNGMTKGIYHLKLLNNQGKSKSFKVVI